MKNDFLKELGLTDDQISKIQAESGKDVQREKDKTADVQKKLDEANTQIQQLNETVKGAQGDADKLKTLQDKVTAYEKADADRKAAEQEASRKAAIRTRFDVLKGEKKYLNEGTETWMLTEFEKAIADKANEGKSDADIYAAITKDKNIFTSPQSKFTNPSAGGRTGVELDGLTKAFLERNPGIKLD